MGRFLAGAAAAVLLLSYGFLIWKGRAEQPPLLPPPCQLTAAEFAPTAPRRKDKSACSCG